MQIKNINEKLTLSIQEMIIDDAVQLPYYGNFNLFVNFQEDSRIDTCGVNVTSKGFNFYYNSDFLNSLAQKEVNFITLHEDFHLIWSHPKRTITGQYDQKLANVAQDMIINHIIVEDIPGFFVEIPKDKEGKNMALFVPKEYKGRLIFEELYDWLSDKQEEHKKARRYKQDKEQNKDTDKNNDNSEGDSDSKNSKYGPYGKNPKSEGGTIDTCSLEQIFDNLEETGGQYLDQHLLDEVPEELRETIVKDAMDRLKSRGFSSGEIEQVLNKLQKRQKDYLPYIKRSVSNLIFGTRKTKTIVKPNRRQIMGIKGNRKVKTKINVILDTSGSMGGLFERALSFIYRSDIEINLIEADTEVKWIKNIKSKYHLKSLPIKGLGGTILQPAIELVADNYNVYNTLILTDGYCDRLDLSRLNGNVLIISVGTKVPISKTNGKTKQILVEKNNN